MTATGETRLVLVDGDAARRQRLEHELAARPGLAVATSMAFRTGLWMVENLQPDVVIVDLDSQSVEGLGLVVAMRAAGSTAAIVGLVDDAHCAAAVRARELLVRVLDRPASADRTTFVTLIERLGVEHTRLRGAAAAPAAPPVAIAPAAPAVRAARPERRGRIEVVGIGVSTGGPKALAELLPMLPADLPVPVLIVQHMPPLFTASLAEQLARQCKLAVREARAGERLRAGEVLIAPGGKHLGVARLPEGIVTRVTEDPPENSCRPAVDYLFRSLASVYGASACAVMMTGMGEDGFAGCRLLHAQGARILAQDEATCTVFGMPRGPIQAGLVHVVAPLPQLAARIVDAVHGDSR